MTNEKSRFLIKIKLGPKDKGLNTMEIDYNVPPLKIVYDDLIDHLYNEMERDFPYEDYPKAEITDIFFLGVAHDNFGYITEFPVMSESDYKAYPNKYYDYDKILILPEYRYSLTPECKLACILSKYSNLIDMNNLKSLDLDMDVMRRLYNDIKQIVDEERKSN